MNKFKIFMLLSLLLLLLFGCKKELDFEADIYYHVKEFLLSKNCQTKCNIPAVAEGKTIKLQGFIDDFHVMEDLNNFQLFDKNNDNYSISVSVDSLISAAVFNKIRNSKTKNARIKGVVHGFDKPTNFTCERGFSIELKYESDFTIE